MNQPIPLPTRTSLGRPSLSEDATTALIYFDCAHHAFLEGARDADELLDVVIEIVAVDLPDYLYGYGGAPLHPDPDTARLFEAQRIGAWINALEDVVRRPLTPARIATLRNEGLGRLVCDSPLFQDWTTQHLLRRLRCEHRLGS